jgi:N-acetylglucosaminyl-diphospho-decaprenol L-rhamnosyltransferase
MTAAELSAVVVTFSPGETVKSFVTSLRAATDHSVQVILADNGSTDGAPEAAAAEFDEVRLLPTGGNLGYGRAANLGVAATDTEWVVVANPDIIWQPGSLDALLDAAIRWPRAAALGPLLRTETGEVYPSARSLPLLGRGIGHAVFGWWWPSNPWTASYQQDRAAPVERVAGWLSGSCLLLRRTAFESVGGFDPDYFMYFEDVDLGDRLGRAGWLNVYVPTAEVTHSGSHATSQHSERMNVEHHRSALRYLSGRYRGRRWLPVRMVLRAGLAARLRLAGRIGRISGGARYQRGRGGNR